jgi:hypothetical protein
MRVEVLLSSIEEPGVFTLQLLHAQEPQQQQAAEGVFSALTAAAAAVGERQPTPQQCCQLAVEPQQELTLPVSFRPKLLHEACAQLIVTIIRLDGSASAEPMVSRYEVRGIARCEAPGVQFAAKCVAKGPGAEVVLKVPLPGLDVGQAEAAEASVAAVPPAPLESVQQMVASGATGGFSYGLLVPAEHRAALASALTLRPLDAAPVMSGSGLAAPPMLLFQLGFAPQKALSAVVQLVVKCGAGGTCWMYDAALTVSSCS